MRHQGLGPPEGLQQRLLCRCLFKRQLQVAQVAAGLHQHQRAFLHLDQRRALTRHMHGLGLGGDGGLHLGDLRRVGLDPLQAGILGDFFQVRHGQRKGRHLGQASGTAGRCRCGNRWCGCWGGRRLGLHCLHSHRGDHGCRDGGGNRRCRGLHRWCGRCVFLAAQGLGGHHRCGGCRGNRCGWCSALEG